MRYNGPILIVLLALVVFAARDQILTPLAPSTPASAPAVKVPAAAPMAAAAAFSSLPDPIADRLDRRAAVTPRVEPVRGQIHRNSSLYQELRKIGVSPQDIDQVARASRKTYNLKRVRPGQRFDAYLSSAGALDSLAFYVSKEQHLFVRRGEDRFHADIEDIPFSVTYHVTQGTINRSVFASLKKQGAETELAGALDEIFGWTIDFINDIRKGDSYVVLYERKEFYDGSTALGNVLAAKVINQGEEHYAFRYGSDDVSEGYYDLDGKSLQKSLRRAPIKFTRVTSNFTGRRFHPVYKTYRPHYGVDYGAPRGTPVYATGDGTVVTAGRRRGNGNYVKIKHNNTYTTYYLHLNGFARGIKSGVRVEQGQLIGYVGSTGAATAPHVCYRVTRNGSWVNPRQLQLPSKDPIPNAEMAAFSGERDGYLVRIQQSILTGLQDGTTVVERPRTPTPEQMQTLF